MRKPTPGVAPACPARRAGHLPQNSVVRLCGPQPPPRGGPQLVSRSTAGFGPPGRRFAPVRRSTPLITLDAPCGSAISWRLGKVCLRQPLPSPCAKLHAANGETARSATDNLGVHAATGEVQEYPARTCRRKRGTTPCVTIRAHRGQAAGTAAAVTRSRVDHCSYSPLISSNCIFCAYFAQILIVRRLEILIFVESFIAVHCKKQS